MAPPKFLDYLRISCVVDELEADTKEEVIEELLGRLQEADLLDDMGLVRTDVLDREVQMSTGLKDGLAIPHAKSEGARELAVALGLKRDGVEFQSVDGEPTRVIFLVVSREDEAGQHLKCLAELARMFTNPGSTERLLKARGDEGILAALNSA